MWRTLQRDDASCFPNSVDSHAHAQAREVKTDAEVRIGRVFGKQQAQPWCAITGKNESEEKRELIFKEDGQGAV